jgi:hypothetical protein
MVDPLNSILNKTNKHRCCHKCIYCNFFGFDTLKSYSCDLKGFSIDEQEIDSKSCWRFVRRKEGIPLERQKHNTKVNRLKRNWYFVIMAFCAIAGLLITLLKILGII